MKRNQDFYVCGWCPTGQHQRCSGGLCACGRLGHVPPRDLAMVMAGANVLDTSDVKARAVEADRIIAEAQIHEAAHQEKQENQEVKQDLPAKPKKKNSHSQCVTCSEDPSHEQYPLNECSDSKFKCGHHSNESWDDDLCAWCGTEFGEE